MHEEIGTLHNANVSNVFTEVAVSSLEKEVVGAEFLSVVFVLLLFRGFTDTQNPFLNTTDALPVTFTTTPSSYQLL